MSSRRLYRATGLPVFTALLFLVAGGAAVVLSYPDREGATAGTVLAGLGLFYGWAGAVGNYVQVRDGALVVANLFRSHRIPLRRFVDLTVLDSLAVYANTTDAETVKIQAMVQLETAGSVRGIRRKTNRLLAMIEEHGAPPADGPVAVRFRWESLIVVAVGLVAFLGGALTYILVYG